MHMVLHAVALRLYYNTLFISYIAYIIWREKERVSNVFPDNKDTINYRSSIQLFAVVTACIWMKNDGNAKVIARC